MYEDQVTDNGVAYNTENFDESYGASLFDDHCCDGCFEDCMMPSEDYARKHCQCFAECKSEWETL